MIRCGDPEHGRWHVLNCSQFQERFRNTVGGTFLKITTFERNGRLHLLKIKNQNPIENASFFLIKTISYERRNPVGIGLL